MKEVLEAEKAPVKRIPLKTSEPVIPVEVYSRVVGYFRPVKNWNKGKKEEFNARVTFDVAASGEKKSASSIAGFIGVSLIDYPGHLASTIFFHGCNLRCPFCHNPELVIYPPKHGFSVGYILEKLRSRSKFIDGVCITGGEPTLYSGLDDFLFELRGMGLKIKLDTNGTRPEVLKRLIKKGLVDNIALDLKAPFSKYRDAVGVDIDTEKIAESIEVVKHFKNGEFRTTCYPPVIDAEAIEELGQLVHGAEFYALQQFRNDKTLSSEAQIVIPYTPDRLLEFKGILEKYVKKVEVRGI